MAGSTTANVIVEREVNLAIEQLFAAPKDTAWTPARVDPSSPPAGFVPLGASVEDTPQLQLTRGRYELQTGIPQILQFQAVRNVGGTFGISVYSNSNRAVRYALGNVFQQKLLIGSFGNAVVINSVGPTTAPTKDRTEIYVPSASINSFAVGDFISAGQNLQTVDGITTGDLEAEVIAVDSGTNKVTVNSPGFQRPLVPGTDKLAKIVHTRVAAGTNKTPENVLLGVADFLDGNQAVHYMPKASATGDWTEQLRPDGAVQVAISFNLKGYTSTVYDSGATHLIVAERFYFPKQ